MEHLTTAERLKIVQIYHENNDSIVGTFRALRKEYGRHNRPSERTIRKIVKKFKETGTVTDVSKALHNRKVSSIEKITAVCSSLEQDPNLSISKRAQNLGISYGTLWRILHAKDPKKAASNTKNVESCRKPKVAIKITEKTIKVKKTENTETSNKEAVEYDALDQSQSPKSETLKQKGSKEKVTKEQDIVDSCSYSDTKETEKDLF